MNDTSYATIRHFLTARDTQARLAEQSVPKPIPAETPGLPSIYFDAAKTFQTIEGFGGAFTESTALTFNKLSPAKQEEFIRAYFDPQEGHGYSLCRVHMNSCDFSEGNWACADVAGDVELNHFTIARDLEKIIPMVLRSKERAYGKLKIFASPWSPPSWMKTNGSMLKGGQLKPEYREVWARYYARFIQEYTKAGVPIWGITIQNEPAAVQPWESCIYSAEEERDFIRDYLGPVFEKNGLWGVKIIIWDHNRDLLVERANVAYSDPRASKYIWGTGFHWYVDSKFENVQLLHDAWPDKQLLFTEGCQENGPHIGSWEIGERYGQSIINDLQRWTVGWVDWNLLLDETGGPNHVGNLCSAPILAKTGSDELIYQSSYYYIGHFARFIKPGARRILCATSKDDLESVGFLNEDGTVAVVVMNRSAKDYQVEIKGPRLERHTADVPARSISTFTVK